MHARYWMIGLVLLLGWITVPSMATGQAYMTRTGHAEFTSSVPLHSFTGTSEHLVGKINLPDSTVDFYLDLTTLETGIGKRDKDMRTTLETDEYPFAEFFGTLVSPFDPTRREPQPATVRGEFKLHGVTRTVTIDGTLQMTPDGLQLEAAWEINLNDYNIEPPSLLIVRVDEIQKVRIEAMLEPVDESS
jgi:polyisoprenoid-binding protein YceI